MSFSTVKMARPSKLSYELKLRIGITMNKATLIIIPLLLATSACADLKDAGRAIGTTTKEVTTEIGHATRDTTKAIGHASRDAVKSVKEDLTKD
jgi:hypothetical protein